MSREAMKLALEALEAGEYYIDDLEAIVYAADDLGTHEDRAKMQAAIVALREALANEALDKKAENARELGLDYEPVCNKDPQGCWNVRCQLGKKCKEPPAQQGPVVVFREIKVGEYVLRFWPSDNGWMCGITSEMMQALAEQPAQQEPVAWLDLLREARDNCKASIVEEGISASRKEYRIDLEARLTAALNTSPPAQRKWVGLTPEETLEEAHKEEQVSGFIHGASWASFKLRERNT